MLDGGPVLINCQRQHLTAPYSHTAKVTAVGTILYRLIQMRGPLQERLIPQLRPTPLYTDSQSTIYVANSSAAVRRSVWLNRRAAVLHEGVDMSEISFEKISDANNVANYYPKPVTAQAMQHYFAYSHPPPIANAM